MAIMRHFAIDLGYFTSEPMQAWAIDASFARYTDFLNASAGPMHFAPEGQKEAGEKWAAVFDKYLSDVEANMDKMKMNCMHDISKPTMADFGITTIYYRYAKNTHEKNIHADAFNKLCFDKHHRIVKCIEAIA